MERSTTPSLNKWLIGGMVGFGMASLLCGMVHAQSALLWPTPEIDGTVRDLTHLPALPQFPMDPTNLQHQAWSQPGSNPLPVVIMPGMWEPLGLSPVDAPDMLAPIAHSPKARQIVQDLITRFERQSR